MKKSELSYSGLKDLKSSPNVHNRQKITISVIGGHETDAKTEKLAENIGKMIAELDAVLVCGGLDGVMKAAARGCQQAGGLTIGLLPGKEKSDANPFIDIALPTTIGFARNAMVACSAHVVIALPGSHGTSSEISYALVYKRPVIDLGGWGVKGMIKASNVDDARLVIVEILKGMKNA
ncbi:MAG: TIGR00725 family protein [Candidatus Omnitrophica bacterium]|nr:TIGR00725 family protein [Candidatus Omnitrophota bacterium]